MSHATHPSPAEVCRQRGWKRDTKIKSPTSAPLWVIRHVDADGWVSARSDSSGSVYTFNPELNLTDWTEIKPPPVVTVEVDSENDSEIDVAIDGDLVFTVRRYMPVTQEASIADRIRYARIGAEAIKAAIQADQDKPVVAECDGPYEVGQPESERACEIISKDDTYGVDISTYDTTCKIFGTAVMAEIVSRHAREIAAELNRLYAAKT